jgi:hypothetical protein
MFLRRNRTGERERGSTIVFVAVSMIVLIAIAGLAVDLVWLYTARSEAQRTADAAALAGASAFVNSPGCTSASGGCVAGGPQEAAATDQAIAAGTQNRVAGAGPKITASDISFNYPTPQNPTITVTVARDATHGGAVPTFFMKVFGVDTKDVSATATAEAFNATGSGIPVGTKCMKPWIMPNCDYNHLVPSSNSNANVNCPVDAASGNYPSKFINGSTIQPGTIGEVVTVKPGDPSSAAAPGKFYPVYLPPGDIPAICPACSSGGGGSGGAASGALYRQNIECCNTSTISCGQQAVQPITGNMVGPTRQGVSCLIHEGSNGSGQDIVTDAAPFSITAGSLNPYFPGGTSPITTSDSIVTVPLYNGTQLCPGNSCPSTVNVDVIGFLQVFVQNVDNGSQGTTYIKVMNAISCAGSSGGGSGGSGGGSGGVSSGGGSPIPVRLIHQ